MIRPDEGNCSEAFQVCAPQVECDPYVDILTICDLECTAHCDDDVSEVLKGANGVRDTPFDRSSLSMA